jgi:hypothetical protein
MKTDIAASEENEMAAVMHFSKPELIRHRDQAMRCPEDGIGDEIT